MRNKERSQVGNERPAEGLLIGALSLVPLAAAIGVGYVIAKGVEVITRKIDPQLLRGSKRLA